jgi:CRISPR-associated protein Cas5t
LRLLKIKLRAPSAHYRIPHSNNPHTTYPAPPYSTVIGILCNMLGKREHIVHFTKQNFCLGMLSSYQSVTREYVWYRNLSVEAHQKRYITTANRQWQERPDHPGGQSPVQIDVLNNVQLIIYLSHSEEIMESIGENATRPERWINHIHLGRSEDWAIPVQTELTNLKAEQKAELTSRTGSYYQWMPKPEFYYQDGEAREEYRSVYEKNKGSVNLVSSLYRFINPVTGEPSNSPAGSIRNFNYIVAKLSCAPLPYKAPALPTDIEEKCSVYLSLIKGGC